MQKLNKGKHTNARQNKELARMAWTRIDVNTRNDEQENRTKRYQRDVIMANYIPLRNPKG